MDLITRRGISTLQDDLIEEDAPAILSSVVDEALCPPQTSRPCQMYSWRTEAPRGCKCGMCGVHPIIDETVSVQSGPPAIRGHI